MKSAILKRKIRINNHKILYTCHTHLKAVSKHPAGLIQITQLCIHDLSSLHLHPTLFFLKHVTELLFDYFQREGFFSPKAQHCYQLCSWQPWLTFCTHQCCGSTSMTPVLLVVSRKLLGFFFFFGVEFFCLVSLFCFCLFVCLFLVSTYLHTRRGLLPSGVQSWNERFLNTSFRRKTALCASFALAE